MKKIKIILSLIGIVLIFNLVAMETEAENIGVERRDFLQEVVIDSTYVLNENDEYHANTVMVIERGGHLVINADIVFKNDCIIDARCGKITINGGGKLSLGKNTLLMLSRYPLEDLEVEAFRKAVHKRLGYENVMFGTAVTSSGNENVKVMLLLNKIA